MKPILDINGLSVAYPGPNGTVHALRDLNFSVEEKEIFGIIGESGAGKTTICSVLMGRLPPNVRCRGLANFKGYSLTALSPKAFKKIYTRKIALVPQGTDSLNPLITIGDHLTETLNIAMPSVRRAPIRQRALELLEWFDLPDPPKLLDRYPFQLSGGMNQLVLLCLAFAGTPDLVICDEPTKSLDPDLKERVISFLKQISLKENLAQVMVTHDLTAARKLCRHLAVLHRGRIVETGPTDSLLDHPLHPYTRALVRALPENGMHPMALPDWDRIPAGGSCAFSPWCEAAPKCEGRPNFPTEVLPNHKVWCSHA